MISYRGSCGADNALSPVSPPDGGGGTFPIFWDRVPEDDPERERWSVVSVEEGGRKEGNGQNKREAISQNEAAREHQNGTTGGS